MRRFLLPGALGLIALASLTLWIRAEQRLRETQERLAAKERQTTQAPPTAAPAKPEPAEEEEATRSDTKIVRVPANANTAEYIKTIEELRANIAEMRTRLDSAREDAARAEQRVGELTAAQQTLQKQFEEAREDAQVAQRTVDALQTEMRSRNDRLVRVEASEKLLTERVAKAEAAASKALAASRELDDIARRREQVINSLSRRYRDVTDLYRNLTLDVQRREQTSGSFQAGDLSRIQSSMQQAEEDLRQLQALNARASQLTRGK